MKMPYKDSETRRAYQREYQRARRRGSRVPPARVDLPTPFRLCKAQDLIDLLEEQIDAVRGDLSSTSLERARLIGSLIMTGAKLLELRDLGARVEALEAVLRKRRPAAGGA